MPLPNTPESPIIPTSDVFNRLPIGVEIVVDPSQRVFDELCLHYWELQWPVSQFDWRAFQQAYDVSGLLVAFETASRRIVGSIWYGEVAPGLFTRYLYWVDRAYRQTGLGSELNRRCLQLSGGAATFCEAVADRISVTAKVLVMPHVIDQRQAVYGFARTPTSLWTRPPEGISIEQVQSTEAARRFLDYVQDVFDDERHTRLAHAFLLQPGARAIVVVEKTSQRPLGAILARTGGPEFQCLSHWAAEDLHAGQLLLEAALQSLPDRVDKLLVEMETTDAQRTKRLCASLTSSDVRCQLIYDYAICLSTGALDKFSAYEKRVFAP